MDTILIGELAKQANVNIETIRYYERRGLIPEPPRNDSGHRQYSTEAVKRTEFIKRCQSLGFSLKEKRNTRNFRTENDTKINLR
jgi:DNA-binding transcriptional MerR regulator